MIEKIYKKLLLYPKGRLKFNDYCSIEFMAKGILISPCVDNAGNEFFLPYKMIDKNKG